MKIWQWEGRGEAGCGWRANTALPSRGSTTGRPFPPIAHRLADLGAQQVRVAPQQLLLAVDEKEEDSQGAPEPRCVLRLGRRRVEADALRIQGPRKRPLRVERCAARVNKRQVRRGRGSGGGSRATHDSPARAAVAPDGGERRHGGGHDLPTAVSTSGALLRVVVRVRLGGAQCKRGRCCKENRKVGDIL